MHATFPTDWDWSGATAAAQRNSTGAGTGSTEVVRELGDLQLAYHSLVAEAVANKLLATLEGPALDAAMQSLVQVGSSSLLMALARCLEW